MLVIRPSQMHALGEPRRKRLRQELAGSLRKHWPEECAALGEAGLMERVRLGVERGRRYGLQEARDFARYLNLMFLLGEEFDTDPRYPWAAAFLKDRGVATARMEQLSAYAVRMLKKGTECR